MNRPLIECDPMWLDGANGRERIGVIFNAPRLDGSSVRIAVGFSNPFDGQPPDEIVTVGDNHEPTYWKRTGETFETLTLEPSINARGRWHGWIQEGIAKGIDDG